MNSRTTPKKDSSPRTNFNTTDSGPADPALRTEPMIPDAASDESETHEPAHRRSNAALMYGAVPGRSRVDLGAPRRPRRESIVLAW